MNHLSIKTLAALMAVFLLIVSAYESFAEDARKHQKDFSLSASYGNRDVLQFQVKKPGRVAIEAEWSGNANSLALILNGQGQTGYYARKDGQSVLKVEYDIKQSDLARGNTFTATITNFSNKGPANGVIRVMYPDAAASAQGSAQHVNPQAAAAKDAGKDARPAPPGAERDRRPPPPMTGKTPQGVKVFSFAPSRGKHGDIITIKGEGFDEVGEVRLGEFTLDIKRKTTDTIEAVVAGPGGHHKVNLQHKAKIGSLHGVTSAIGEFNIFFEPMKDMKDTRPAPPGAEKDRRPPPPMKKDKAERAARLKTGLLKVLDKLEDRRQISRAGASKLRAGIQKGEFKNAPEFLDEAQDVMVKEAEDAVGGPVDDSIVAASMKSGKSIKEVAMDWSHCHNEESPKSGIGVKHQDYRRNGKSRMVGIGKFDYMGDDRHTDCMSASGAKAKYHSHIVVDSKAIGIADLGQRMKRMQLAMNGKRPSVIPRHMHRDNGFLTGKLYIPPSKKDDDLLDDAMDVAEDVAEVAVDVAKWSKEHAATIGSGVKIVAIVTGGVILAPVTGGGSLAVAAVLAGPVLKEVAVILVDTEAVDVEDMGLKKKDVIDGIGMIPA